VAGFVAVGPSDGHVNQLAVADHRHGDLVDQNVQRSVRSVPVVVTGAF
jgi:hypothetical protein